MFCQQLFLVNSNTFIAIILFLDTADELGCDWDFWSTWSVCNATCPPSIKSRTRVCLQIPKYKNQSCKSVSYPCIGENEQTQDCTTCIPGKQSIHFHNSQEMTIWKNLENLSWRGAMLDAILNYEVCPPLLEWYSLVA